MPNVLVRDLPDDVHSALQRRAASAGQSLQQYLVGELTRLAHRPTMSEVLARAADLEGGHVGLATAVADLHAERPAS
jgi:plasmid stability protein